MTAPDFAAILADNVRSASWDGRTINSPQYAAECALAALVPEPCQTCAGESVIYDLRCDNCGGSASLPLGMTCENHHAKPQPCPDCPTIGRLLAIGTAVMTARMESPEGSGRQGVLLGGEYLAQSADRTIAYLRAVQP